MKERIVDILIKAKKAYYEGTPLMTDEEFDELEDQLRKSDPDNDYFKIVGSPIVKGAKIKHEVDMLSCQKAKVIADIVKWLNKISDKRLSLIIEPKIDSLSGAIKYINGTLSYIATRGDGEVGQDITHIKDYLNIPKTLPNNLTIEVRGEIYLPKNNTVPNPKNKPLRNIAVGLINRKEHTEDHKQLRFVAYQIVNSKNVSEEEDLVQLKALGFYTATCVTVNAVNKIEEYYKHYLDSLRVSWEFETDGLVITINNKELQRNIDSKWIVEHHHHYNIALKPISEVKETKLTGIEWNLSRHGYLIPIALFNSITILGRDIKKASLTNYQNVVDMNLEIGDKLLVSLANDVIPYVEENISKGIKQRR